MCVIQNQIVFNGLKVDEKNNSVRGGLKFIYCLAQKAEYWYCNGTINLKM